MGGIAYAAAVRAYEIDEKHNQIVLDSVDDFGKCRNDIGNSDACFDALKRFVKAHPRDGFAAGKAVRRSGNAWVALQFFVPTLSKATAQQYCGDDDLRLAVLSGLALPADEPGQPLAMKAASGVCAAKLHRAIREGFADANTYYRQNACVVLAKQPDAPMECKASAPAEGH